MKEDQEPASETQTEPSVAVPEKVKGKKKLLIIVIVSVILVALVGYLLLKGKAEHTEEAAVKPAVVAPVVKQTLYFDVDPFWLT